MDSMVCVRQEFNYGLNWFKDSLATAKRTYDREGGEDILLDVEQIALLVAMAEHVQQRWQQREREQGQGVAWESQCAGGELPPF